MEQHEGTTMTKPGIVRQTRWSSTQGVVPGTSDRPCPMLGKVQRPPALTHLHLRPFSVLVNRTLGAFSPTVRSNAAMCSRSATDLLTSRPFVPLPRGTFHHRSHKLLGSSVPSWRRASAHARHDSARAAGGRRAVRLNGHISEPEACANAGDTPTGIRVCWHRPGEVSQCTPRSARKPFGKSGVHTTEMPNAIVANRAIGYSGRVLERPTWRGE